MTTIVGILIGLLMLGLMMFVHELGHYIAGRKLGFTIIEFSIFMGPRLLSWERNGIRYSLKLIPIGASVQFSGEYNGDPQSRQAAIDEGYVPQPGDFFERPCWARAIVSFAGPAVNLLCGVLAFVVLFSAVGSVVPLISEVQPNSMAAEAGLLPGDRVTDFDGDSVHNVLDIQAAMLLRNQKSEKPIPLTFERDGVEQTVELYTKPEPRPSLGITMSGTADHIVVASAQDRPDTPADAKLLKGDELVSIAGEPVSVEAVNAFWAKDKTRPMPVTIVRDGKRMTLEVKPLLIPRALPLGLFFTKETGVLRAIPYSISYSWSIVKVTFRSLGRLIVGKMSAKENLSGPVGVVSMISGVVTDNKVDWTEKLVQLLSLFALISLSLGIMNLLPIPPLDGNHLVMTGIEAVRGKPVSLRVQTIISYAGLAIIILLFALGFYFDLSRLMGF